MAVISLAGCRSAPQVASIRYGRPDSGARLVQQEVDPKASLAQAPPPDPKSAETSASGHYVQTSNGLRYVPGAADDLEKPKPKIKDRVKQVWHTATLSTPDRIVAEDYYQEGEKLFAEKKYDAAARKYKQAAARWPDSALQEDSMFMRGEALFFADRYAKANDLWGEMLKKYENSRHLDKVVSRQFTIARYWEDAHKAKPHWFITPNFFDETRPMFDTPGNALATYDSIRVNDPTGPLADDAIMATANAHFLNQKYDDADYYYALVRSDYPKSEHQRAAHTLGLRSKMLAYQGSMYDAKPLVDARELTDHTASQFIDQTPEERERLNRTRAVIQDQLAQRDWDMAEFYSRTKHYKSARYYYARVMRDHPDSRYAQLAESKMGETKDLPDAPEERLTWLANMFPGERKKSRERMEARVDEQAAKEQLATLPRRELDAGRQGNQSKENRGVSNWR